MIEYKSFISKIGKNLLYTQGIGSNASWKTQNYLNVKASGKRLRDAKKSENHTRLNRKFLNYLFKYNIENIPYKNLKPSIETHFHNIIEYKYVLHLHHVDSIFWLCQKNIHNFLKKKFQKKQYDFISYSKPGLQLAKKINKKIVNNGVKKIYFLQNHGIIISSNKIKELESILMNINYIFSLPSTRQRHLDFNKEKLPISILNFKYIDDIGKDAQSFNFFRNNFYLTPDIAVIFGRYKIKFLSSKKIKITSNDKSIYFIKGKGMICNFILNKYERELLQILFYISIKCVNPDNFSSLSDKQINTLKSWDAEKYRLKLIK